MRSRVVCVLIRIVLSGLANDEAINLVLLGNVGYLTNITEHCSFSQKYLPFPPLTRSPPHFGHLTIGSSSDVKMNSVFIEDYF